MNREYELISYLKQPVLRNYPVKWNKQIPFSARWIAKSYGGKNKGRWLVFRMEELGFHKPFSDALLATLAAKGLLIAFSKENDRAFFLREVVEQYVDNKTYCYDEYAKTLSAYKRI